MKVEEGILTLHSILSKDFCNQIIKLSEKLCTEKIRTLGGDTEFRKGLGHTLQNTSLRDQIYFQIINNEIKKFFNHFTYRFPKAIVAKLTEVQLLKYEEGGKYFTHVDSSASTYRHVSIIMNLNEDYEGGDLVFSNQFNSEMKRVKLKTGSVVMFPSNFMYPHKIEPIKKGKRYSIVTWLI